MTKRIVTELHPWERWFAWQEVRIGPFGKMEPPYTLVKGEWVERRIAYGDMGNFSFEYRETAEQARRLGGGGCFTRYGVRKRAAHEPVL